MADITPQRRNLQLEEARFRFAVSESFAQKMGSSVNFINYYQHSEKKFILNGPYNNLTTPSLGVDGFAAFQYNAEIIDTWMFVKTAGTSGTTELDIKYATTPGGSFTSIFSTTPKITSSAGSNVWIHVGSAVANTTAPVLNITNVDAEWAIRMDLIQAQSGTAVRGCEMIVHYRPR